MLDHDPRYLRPETREDMNQRIQWLSASTARRRRREKTKPPPDDDAIMDIKQETESLSSSTHEIHSPDLVATPFDQWKGFYGHSQSSSQTPYGFPAGHVPHPPNPSYQQFLPRSAPQRRGTMDSQSSIASTQTIEDLKLRLSGCSTHYATQVSYLLRKFTIGSVSDLSRTPPSLTRRASAASSEGPQDASYDGNFALPGDFFNAFKYQAACFRGSTHDAGLCWCAVAASIAQLPDFWVTPSDSLSPIAQRILHEPSRMHLSLRDRFGNTPLHLFASREGFQMQLIGMAMNIDVLGTTNTGGQTFLHVLAPGWFSGLDDQYAPLFQLLAHIQQRQPDILFLSDVYGRTFFHRLAKFLSAAPELLSSILQPYVHLLPHYDRFAFTRRDAFGSRADPSPPTPSSAGGNLSPAEDDSGSPFPSEDAFIRHHESLLRIVTASDADPAAEDAGGRNGLHCLAEAIIDKGIMDEHRNALSTGRPVKRKPDKKAKAKPRVASDSSDGEPVASPQLATRARLVQGLLAGGTVDANHYSLRGETALMAFVAHLPDDQEDKAKNLAATLEALLAAGARVEGRNRRGETALLVAARLGRKIALVKLLEHGASVHARDAEGRGVLDVIDHHCRAARHDVTLYGRLEACRVILTGKRLEKLGVMVKPGVVDEWSVRSRDGDGGGMMDLS
jgi:hypothetical protein